MPMKKVIAGGATADDLAARAAFATADRPDPLQPPPEPGPGFFESFYLGARTHSIFGSGAQRLGFLFGEDDYPDDPRFNPYDKLDETFLERYPYTLGDFESGRVLDLRNESQFWHYVMRKERDFLDRQRLAEGSLAGTFLGAAAPDIVGAGAIFKTARGVRAAVTGGRIGATAGKAAGSVGLIGGAGIAMGANVSQELALQAINPDRNVGLGESLAGAAVIGGLLALGVPLLGRGIRAVGGRLPNTRWMNGLQQRVAREIAQTHLAANAEELVTSHSKGLETMLAETPDGPRTITVVRSPATDALIEQVQKRWADAGHRITVLEDPQQPLVDWMLAVQRLDDALQGAMPAERHGPMAAAAKALEGIPGTALEIPGAAARRSASSVARRAIRAFFIDSTATAETLADPLHAVNNPSAEALRFNITWLKENAGEGMDAALREHFKTKRGPITAALSDGSTVTISRYGHRRQFGRLVKDYIHQQDQMKRGVRLEMTFTAPQAVVDAAEAWRHYVREMLDRAEEAGRLKGPKALAVAQKELEALEAEAAEWQRGATSEMLSEADINKLARAEELRDAKRAEVRQIETWIENAESYVSRRWLRHEIVRSRESFTARLVQQWQHNRRIDRLTGKAIAPGDAEILDGALRQADSAGNPILSPADVERLRGSVTLGDAIKADPTIRARYDMAVDSYLLEQARKTTDVLTDASNAHGIEQAFAGGNVFKERTLQIEESNFREFLDNDLLAILNFYDHKTGGDIAARIAIRRDEAFWAPLVERLTGKKLADEAWNPELVAEAVRRDFLELMDAARKANPDGKKGLQRLVEQSQNRTLDILNRKLDELRGINPFHADPAADAGWKAAGRTMLRMPFMAMMGGMTISSLADTAGQVMLAQTTPQMIRAIGRDFIGMLPGLKTPRWGLEAFEVANEEGVSRLLKFGELDELPMDPRLATSAGGGALAYADRATDYLARKFGTVSLMNRWNTNARRVTAHMVMNLIVQGARRLVKAADLEASGKPAAEALRLAGLSAEDAARLARLGITPARARRLLDLFRKHGKDYGGRPLRDLPDEQWAAFRGQISPEYADWYKAEPQLFDILTSAVNTEVRNIIVEPSLLSRPLLNQRWLGKAVNQFWSFAYAWGNQFAKVAAQRPATQQGIYLMLAVGVGGVIDALHNQLAGRRSFEDTARMWQEHPAAMLITSADRAGLFGWIARPNALLHHAGLSPQMLLGNDISSMHAAQSLNYMGAVLGPSFDYWNRVANGALTPAFPGNDYDAKSLHLLRTTVPFQNLFALSGIYQTSRAMGVENPAGPGRGIDPFLTKPSLEQHRRSRQEAQPF